MIGHKKLNFLIGIVFFGFAFTISEIDKSYSDGKQAYENGQFELAIQNYELILKSKIESPELYYNLGNAYYRNGSISGAVWAFEKCIKLSPGDGNAEYNLKLVNVKVKDRMEIPSPPFYLKTYKVLKQSLTSNGWILLFSFLFLAFSSFIALTKIFQLKFLEKIVSLSGVVLIFVILIGANAVWDNYSVREGIIMTKTVDAYSAPKLHSTHLFMVHEGLKVSLKNSTEDWIEIELIDGKKVGLL